MEYNLLKKYLIEAIATVVPPHGGAFVAGPVSTGKRFYELMAHGEHLLATDIRKKNSKAMRSFVLTLRERLPYPVIDPGVLDVTFWTNDQIGENNPPR